MNTHADKSQATGNHAAAASREREPDNPESIQESSMPLQQMANGSARVNQLKAIQAMANRHAFKNKTVQRKKNDTGLPDQLKSGIEQLSGYSMDDVKVHYNSAKPTQLEAHAYAQGADIHVAPGQEQHLAHEAWHLVQQKQGRVQATTQLKADIPVNDDAGLEKEADEMGARALTQRVADNSSEEPAQLVPFSPVSQLKPSGVIQAKVKSGVLNVAGESHDEYDRTPSLRDKERKMASDLAGGAYWTEAEFKVTESDWWWGTKKGQSGDPVLLQFLQTLELVDSYGGKHMKDMDHTVTDHAKVLRGLAENCARVLAGGVQARYSALADEVSKKLVELDEKQLEAAGALGAKITEMQNACIALYGGINDDGSLKDPGATVATNKATCIRLNKEINDLGNILHKKTMTQENIRVPRSQQMHFSAQASFAAAGIWKIGNNHYNDISEYVKGTFKKNPKYNLLSKDEFNDERDKIV